MKKFVALMLVCSIMLISISCNNMEYTCEVCSNKVQVTDNYCSACGAAVSIPKEDAEDVVYTEVTLSAISEEWSQNKTRAEAQYLDKYVCIKGTVNSIDDDYEFSISDRDSLLGILESATCIVKNTQLKEIVLILNRNDNVIIKGKIKSFDSLLFGVNIEVDSIVIEE